MISVASFLRAPNVTYLTTIKMLYLFKITLPLTLNLTFRNLEAPTFQQNRQVYVVNYFPLLKLACSQFFIINTDFLPKMLIIMLKPELT